MKITEATQILQYGMHYLKNNRSGQPFLTNDGVKFTQRMWTFSHKTRDSSV